MVNCRMCKVIRNETPLAENSECGIYHTKNMKGHHKRVMVITRKHVKTIDDMRELQYLGFLIRFSRDYFDEEPTFALVEDTYASHPSHWHRIACDWYGTPEEQILLKYTPHVAIHTNKVWDGKVTL